MRLITPADAGIAPEDDRNHVFAAIRRPGFTSTMSTRS